MTNYDGLARDSITGGATNEAAWPDEAADGQARFLAGPDSPRGAGLWAGDLEEGKRRLIGRHGGEPLLLVWGPPGTGTTTTLAVLSRLQKVVVTEKDRVHPRFTPIAEVHGQMLALTSRMGAVLHEVTNYPDLYIRDFAVPRPSRKGAALRRADRSDAAG